VKNSPLKKDLVQKGNTKKGRGNITARNVSLPSNRRKRRTEKKKATKEGPYLRLKETKKKILRRRLRKPRKSNSEEEKGSCQG